jgi:hypothetical protein
MSYRIEPTAQALADIEQIFGVVHLPLAFASADYVLRSDSSSLLASPDKSASVLTMKVYVFTVFS